MQEFIRYEPHGHSNVSDGLESPKAVARAAIGKVDVIALADHNTTAGLGEFIDEIKRINDQEISLTGVPSIEVSTSKGHLLVCVADPTLADKFINWGLTTRLRRIDSKSLVLHTVQEFNGVCIFAHPMVPHSGGFSLEDIERLVDSLPPDMVTHLALETINNTASIIPGYFYIQRRVRAWNKQFKLAEVAGSDFHTKYLIGRVFTDIPIYGEHIDITHAIQNRLTVPDQRRITPLDILLTTISHGSSYQRYRLGINSRSWPTKLVERLGEFSK